MRSSRYTLLRVLFAEMPAFVASVIMATTFVACHVSNPMEPEPSAAVNEQAMYAATQSSCPTFQDACVQGRDEVLKNCPADGHYKKPSDHKKCVRIALRAYVTKIDTCFSKSDLNSLERCILGSMPAVVDSSGGAGKDLPESLP